MILKPASANRSAIPRPIICPEPVIKAVRLSFSITNLLTKIYSQLTTLAWFRPEAFGSEGRIKCARKGAGTGDVKGF